MFDKINTEEDRELRNKAIEGLESFKREAGLVDKNGTQFDLGPSCPGKSEPSCDAKLPISGNIFKDEATAKVAMKKIEYDSDYKESVGPKTLTAKVQRYPSPLHNKVAVLQTKTAESIGNIYIPESARKKENTGIVVALGPDVKSAINKGDLVQFGEYCGVETTVDKIEYFVMSERDILAIIPKD